MSETRGKRTLVYAARVTDARSSDANAAGRAACCGCGGRHFATERVCPLTKRPIDEGAFGTMIGPYRVGKLLGSGGFSIVHVAQDTRTEARVALKLLHPELVADRELLDRFVREAEVTVRAGNPHIVRVLEASFTGRTAYVALELLSGETLASALRRGPMPAARAVDIAIQTLDGLAVAHNAGVIHRDIKPANVFLADGPEGPRSLVKLLDFGIGRVDPEDAQPHAAARAPRSTHACSDGSGRCALRGGPRNGGDWRRTPVLRAFARHDGAQRRCSRYVADAGVAAQACASMIESI